MSKYLIKVMGHLTIVIMLSVSTEGIAAPIFADGFESGNLSHRENGFKWGGTTRAAVSTDISHTGSHSLKFAYPSADPNKDSWAEQRFDLGNTYPEVWIQYYIYFPNGTEGISPKYQHRNSDGTLNNKFLRLWGNIPRTDSHGAIVGGGASLWRGNDNLSKLRADYFATYNGKVTKGMGGVGPSSYMDTSMLGRWIKFKYHVKVASAANNNGVLQIWFDNVLVTDERGLKTYPGNGYQNAFTAGYLLGWANAGFDKATNIYIDDVVVSKYDISSQPGTAAPNPPLVD